MKVYFPQELFDKLNKAKKPFFKWDKVIFRIDKVLTITKSEIDRRD